VLFLVGWGLIDFHHIKQIMKASKAETGVLVVTFLSTLFLELELAIFAGVMLSLVMYLIKVSNPEIHARVPDPESSNRKFTDTRAGLPECPQMHIIRIDGSLFFGAVNHFQEVLLSHEKGNPGCKHLLIIMQGVNFLDVAGAEALTLLARRYRARGGGLYLIRPKEPVLSRLERGSYIQEIGRENIFISKTPALRAVYRKLDYDICRVCQRHVFVECARMGKQEPLEDEVPGPVTAASK
jgi:sulfate permease, SulP family